MWRVPKLDRLLAVGLFFSYTMAFAAGMELLMPPLKVDTEGDRCIYCTPFDYRHGVLVTAHVEPPLPDEPDNRMNLRTVVSQGIVQPDGTWRWQDHTVSFSTRRDPYHAQPSIVMDQEGYVHVVYNMHNMPWQYSVSKAPYDIGQFEFRGQPVSSDKLMRLTVKNLVDFPDVGQAAIPGNQITYPAFFTDRHGEVYVTYRYALRPARAWEQRTFGGGIARYNTTTRRWTSVGGALPISTGDAVMPTGVRHYISHPFAFDDQYVVNIIALAFDVNNGMHVVWSWRKGGTGLDEEVPSYAYSPDGGMHFYHADHKTPYTLPISHSDTEPILDVADKYVPQKSVTAFNPDAPSVILMQLQGPRTVYSLMADGQGGAHWNDEGVAPYWATEITTDKYGRQWAVASGLKLFTRRTRAEQWTQALDMGQGLIYPKVKYDAAENALYILAKSHDAGWAMIYRYRLPSAEGVAHE